MLASQGPVGTRGGVVWMRGPGACPRWGATCLLHAVPTGSRCHQDKHPAPTLPHIRPLSLQDPIRSSTFSRDIRCGYPGPQSQELAEHATRGELKTHPRLHNQTLWDQSLLVD